MYTLMFWIIGCVGLSCEIPATETLYFETVENCQVGKKTWKLSNESNSGICLPGVLEKIDDGIFYDKSKSK